MLAMVIDVVANDLKPVIDSQRRLIARWSCSRILLRYLQLRTSTYFHFGPATWCEGRPPRRPAHDLAPEPSRRATRAPNLPHCGNYPSQVPHDAPPRQDDARRSKDQADRKQNEHDDRP